MIIFVTTIYSNIYSLFKSVGNRAFRLKTHTIILIFYFIFIALFLLPTFMGAAETFRWIVKLFFEMIFGTLVFKQSMVPLYNNTRGCMSANIHTTHI